MKKLAIFLIILFLVSCYKEDELFELSGEIKKIDIYYEEIRETVGVQYYYTNFGKVALERWSDSYGSETGKVKYYYDSERRLTEVESTVPNGRFTKYLTYDKDGNLVNTVGTGKAGSFDYVYDAYDRLVKMMNYILISQEKNYDYIVQYEYDSVDIDRIVNEITYMVNGNDLSDLILYENLFYEYDSENRLVQKKLVDGKGHFYRGTKEFYLYDVLGRIDKKLVYNLDINFHSGLESTSSYYYYE
jgi:hypothetical protein